MKNLFFIACIAIFGLFKLNAQDSGAFTIASQTGVNLSTYASSSGFDARISFNVGIIGEYYFNDSWSIRSGFVYDNMGAEDSFGNTDKLSYISVPVNVNFHFGSGRNWYVNFGPQISFIVSAEADLANGREIDIEDGVNSVDIGVAAGIGYKFDVLDNFQLFVDIQGYGGFLTVNDINLFDDLRNVRSSFNVGGIFKL